MFELKVIFLLKKSVKIFKRKSLTHLLNQAHDFRLVGTTRFELATPTTPR